MRFARLFKFRDRRGTRGIGLIEVMISGFILSVCIFSALSIFNNYNRGVSSSVGNTSIEQLEQVVRRNIFATLQAYFRSLATSASVCNPVVVPLNLNQTFSSGITSQIINTRLSNSIFSQIASSPLRPDGGIEEFRAGLRRCTRSRTGNLNQAYFNSNRGLYFCLAFTPSATFSSGAGSALDQMQPIFGEFYYTTQLLDAARPPNPPNPPPPLPMRIAPGPITCPQYASILGSAFPQPRPTAGLLYYMIHWVPKSPGRALYNRKSGLVYLGN